jgi:hypothetical protein
MSGCVWETLERRALLSGSAALDVDGILTVNGTDNADAIWIYRDRDNPDFVNVSFQAQGGGGIGFRTADLRGIVVNGLGGDDFIGVWNDPYHEVDLFTVDTLTEFGKLNIPVTMYGGDGDDELFSESNADDLLIGGRGLDHAYALDGHDRFAVESVENYRGTAWLTDPNTGLRYFSAGGGFRWKGPEDQIYADPWEVPTRLGTYGGANIPTFPEDNSNSDDHGGGGGGHGGHHHANGVAPVTADVTNDGDDHGQDTATPVIRTAPQVPPPSPFSVQPLSFDGDGHKPWDDALT